MTTLILSVLDLFLVSVLALWFIGSLLTSIFLFMKDSCSSKTPLPLRMRLVYVAYFISLPVLILCLLIERRDPSNERTPLGL